MELRNNVIHFLCVFSAIGNPKIDFKLKYFLISSFERKFVQDLRQQQDEAYEQSLRADQEKERLKQLEKDRILQQQQQEEAERLEKQRQKEVSSNFERVNFNFDLNLDRFPLKFQNRILHGRKLNEP